MLHAPRNVAGQAGDAVTALRRLGHHAELWLDDPDAFGRPADRVFRRGPDGRAVWGLVEEAAERFDVLHFHFAQSLVAAGASGMPPLWDLPLYRALGRRVFFTFHGSDVRIDRVFREQNPWAGMMGTPPADDDRREQTISVIRDYADAMFVTSPNYLDFVPDAVYLPRLIDLAAWPELPVAQRPRPVVVHAPSRRALKGSEQILADLEALRSEGVQFDLRVLDRVPHAEVRRALAEADVLVDNIVAGSYGIVSLEAMACGRVAVANLSERMRRAHPDAPVVEVSPPTFRDRMRALLADVSERRLLAERGRPFVAADHSADRMAERLVEAYRTPPQPVRARSVPGWVPVRRTADREQLERRVARLEADLARARRREADLREILGMRPAGPSAARRLARAVLPHRLRARLLALAGR